MARAPKGSYVRATPDWFTDAMAFAGAYQQASDTSHNAYVGLYNDAVDGSSLHVMALGVEVEPTTNHTLGFIEQTLTSGFIGPYSALYAHGRAVRLNRPAPYGQSRAANTPGGNTEEQIILLGGAYSGLLVAPGWPLWILPPTYALWLQANLGGGSIYATFWYLVIHD